MALHLRHLQLTGLTSYMHAAALQSRYVSAFLAYKANPSTTAPPPPPVVITAQFHPVYTCGRREIGALSNEQINYLTEPTPWGRADFHEALRGGQTTFHGPGQLVAYPIIDLRRHALTPRCYVSLLETVVIDTCAHYDIETRRTGNPGVWVVGEGEKKICALGVHLRRNVTSHGVGLNVGTELGWFGRIVACGLEGKGTTSLKEEGAARVPGVEEVGVTFAQKLAEHLIGVEGVEGVEDESLQ